ncbi:MAG: asparagine synthase, partial [Deltaproteobacteria bacterium]|nr:asparagine synthase [Deltaproteobacteria bacterium]
GYDPFRALRRASFYDRVIPGPVHEGIRMLAARLPVSHRHMSFDFRLKRTLRGLSYPEKFWMPVWLGPLSPGDIEELFGEPVDMEDLFSEAVAQWEACQQENMIDKTLQFYTRLYLQDDILVKTDRASMMHSLEVRAPYLDIDLVDFVRRIPGQYKFRNGVTKYMLKKALRPLLPREIRYRSKKGFAVPVGKWFKDGRLDVEPGRPDGPLNALFVKKKITEHKSGLHDHRAFLWNHWLLNHFDNSL